MVTLEQVNSLSALAPTGIVTISAEYFDPDGLSELALGGVRLVVLELLLESPSNRFKHFLKIPNNVIPTQRAIAAFEHERQ